MKKTGVFGYAINCQPGCSFGVFDQFAVWNIAGCFSEVVEGLNAGIVHVICSGSYLRADVNLDLCSNDSWRDLGDDIDGSIIIGSVEAYPSAIPGDNIATAAPSDQNHAYARRGILKLKIFRFDMYPAPRYNCRRGYSTWVASASR